MRPVAGGPGKKKLKKEMGADAIFVPIAVVITRPTTKASDRWRRPARAECCYLFNMCPAIVPGPSIYIF
jgi:hypothetical protein